VLSCEAGVSLQFNISADETVTVITTVLTSVTTNDTRPLSPALAANAAVANDQSGAAAAKIEGEAALFWQQFWDQSSVELGPKWGEAERYWYASQYLMGMASRAGRIAPGLWGPWVTTDSPAWCGGYTLDYNFEVPFQHLFSSNRAAIAGSYFPVISDYAKRNGGHEAADPANGKCNATAGGIKGFPGAVHFTIQLAPGGLANSGNLGVHSNALFASLNFVSEFEFSQNATWLAEESYPFLRAVLAWWQCWLVKDESPSFPGGYRYNDNNTCTREGCFNGPHGAHDKDTNPALSIAFLLRLLTHALEVSARGLVSPPAHELAQWKDMLAHLAPIPVGVAPVPPPAVRSRVAPVIGQAPATPVLLPQEWPIYTFPDQAHDNPLEFYGLFPGEQIGMSSDPKLLEAGRNTVLLANVTDPLQENGFQIISWLRAGCVAGCPLNATYILATLCSVVSKRMGSNGYLRQGGGGIETAGGAVALNDMLLQSFERVESMHDRLKNASTGGQITGAPGNFLRFFPLWPTSDDASFFRLRAVGAFVVSASIKGGVVQTVTVLSEAGLNCTFVSPWPTTAAPPIVRSGDSSSSLSGKPVAVAAVVGPQGLGLWRFQSTAGTQYTIARTGAP
jgi:hypothetical protein